MSNLIIDQEKYNRIYEAITLDDAIQYQSHLLKEAPPSLLNQVEKGFISRDTAMRKVASLQYTLDVLKARKSKLGHQKVIF